MVHTYSSAAAAEPLSKIVQVLDDTRSFRSMPDNTRRRMFDQTLVRSGLGTGYSMPLGRVWCADLQAAVYVDLMSENEEEEESESSGDVTSSSGPSSECSYGQSSLKGNK